MKSKRAVISFYLVLFVLGGCSVEEQADLPTEGMEGIEADFLNPPAETRPGCYWYWINDNVSKEGISKDLEAMARIGIGRAYIGHIYNHEERSVSTPVSTSKNTPVGDVKFMSDAWWEAVQWAVKEGGRCGIEIGFFNSPGWSQSGGPWVKPSQSMRYLAHSETLLSGGRLIDQNIAIPEITTFPVAGGSRPVQTGPKFTESDFQDVRLIAFRQPETEAKDIDMSMVKASSENIADVENYGMIRKKHLSYSTGTGSWSSI